MKKKILYLFSIFIFSSSFALAQKDKSREFDFWIGEWNIEQHIRNQNGDWLEFLATTKVESIVEKNVIVENWAGKVQFFWKGMNSPQKISGYSIRYYDKTENKWFIYWMDSLDPTFSKPFTGNFSDKGQGVFYRANVTENGIRYSRITFQQINKNKVNWELAVSDNQTEWTTIWKMNMIKKLADKKMKNIN